MHRRMIRNTLFILFTLPALAWSQVPLRPGQMVNIVVGAGPSLVQVMEVQGHWIRVTNAGCQGREVHGKADPDTCWINTAMIDRFLVVKPIPNKPKQ